jgi:hypothetical protein
MLSSLFPLLVVMGVLCWVVLPGLILLAAAMGLRHEPAGPVWVRRCRGSDPADRCWVTDEAKYCPKHEAPPSRPQLSGREIYIA